MRHLPLPDPLDERTEPTVVQLADVADSPAAHAARHADAMDTLRRLTDRLGVDMDTVLVDAEETVTAPTATQVDEAILIINSALRDDAGSSW